MATTKGKTRDYTYAVGRRKTATARIRLYDKKTVPGFDHKIIVNGKSAEEYFPGNPEQKPYLKPFEVIEESDKFSVSAKVHGSGLSSQLDAVIHGIARALSKYNTESFRPSLKSEGLLTRDSRKRERRKVGTGGKARRQKQSPKR